MRSLLKFQRILFLLAGFIIVITSCKRTPLEYTEPGVTSELAELRNKQLKDIKYNISFAIPDSVQGKITGSVLIEFDFSNQTNEPLILDFRNESSDINSVKAEGQKINYQFKNEHLIIPTKYLKNGKNKLEIDFIAGERALNRNKEYLYTLFVPDRACTAFPCFDQPSLKATFKPTLTIPQDWIAVANSPLIKKETNQKTETFYFAETEPISTYLFSFVAGKFQSVTQKRDNREITMFHRESDSEKVSRNTDKIFELKFSSLKWLEEYTQIKYPFTKLDFIIIPSFQYSGMEHPGAVLYRDSKLFLEESATIRDELNRANLIAHETAHMWFGDLVTMEWFSEVWLKEVFANFMADKIVNPQFPNINHNLNFLINHYPSSYSIDRTKGANPIGQELDNMKNAGTIYGPIVYHKAPIMMSHLEQLTGDKILQEGVQEYLNKYKYNNATWDNLIQILDKKIETNLRKWSRVWVYEPGMPQYIAQKAYNPSNQLSSIIIEQKDPMEKGRIWIQNLKTIVSSNNNVEYYHTQTRDTFTVINIEKPIQAVNYIFSNANGLGYGYFKIDTESKKYLLDNMYTLDNDVLRCALYINLWENMLNDELKPSTLLKSYLKALNHETDDQNVNLLLSYIQTAFWKFLTSDEKQHFSKIIEESLWTKLKDGTQKRVQSSYFKAYTKIALNDSAINNLVQVFNGKISIKNLQLSTRDYTDLAFELAIRDIEETDEILNTQYQRIEDDERKSRFEFIKPALSANEQVRD
ncbi:MAG: M1 family metallopeptidase, partial [Bacteroidota bacterium]